MIHGFCQTNMIWEGYLGKMVVSGISFDLVTHNTIMHVYCGGNQILKALELRDKMVGEHGSPDLATCTSIIYGLCKQASLDEAVNCLHVMLNAGLFPNAITWNVLAHAALHESDLSKPVFLLEAILDNPVILLR